jgi:hypothetical protein
MFPPSTLLPDLLFAAPDFRNPSKLEAISTSLTTLKHPSLSLSQSNNITKNIYTRQVDYTPNKLLNHETEHTFLFEDISGISHEYKSFRSYTEG